jgi:hypothetical protein
MGRLVTTMPRVHWRVIQMRFSWREASVELATRMNAPRIISIPATRVPTAKTPTKAAFCLPLICSFMTLMMGRARTGVSKMEEGRTDKV